MTSQDQQALRIALTSNPADLDARRFLADALEDVGAVEDAQRQRLIIKARPLPPPQPHELVCWALKIDDPTALPEFITYYTDGKVTGVRIDTPHNYYYYNVITWWREVDLVHMISCDRVAPDTDLVLVDGKIYVWAEESRQLDSETLEEVRR